MRPGVVLLCLTLIAIVLVLPVMVLEVRLPDGAVVLKRPLPPDGRFELRYVHSWDKTPVYDVFSSDQDGQLLLVEEQYLWMGAGLDFHPDARLDFSSNRVRVLAPRPIGILHLAVGTVADQRLVFGQTKVSLNSLALPGTKLTLQLKKVSVLAALSGLIP